MSAQSMPGSKHWIFLQTFAVKFLFLCCAIYHFQAGLKSSPRHLGNPVYQNIRCLLGSGFRKPEISSLNPVIGNFNLLLNCIEKTKIKKIEAGNRPIFKETNIAPAKQNRINKLATYVLYSLTVGGLTSSYK